MALTEQEQLLKDQAIKAEKREFVLSLIELANVLQDVFYKSQSLTIQWFTKELNTSLVDSDLSEFAMEVEDITSLVGALQDITANAQAVDKQWVQKVAKIAKSK